MLTVRYQRLGLRAGDRVLDLGSGGGRHAFEAMRRGADVVAADLDAGATKDVRTMMGAVASESPSSGRGAVAVSDARLLPFGDNSFDRVIAAEVLEHIHDDRQAIAELARVLRPGGTIAVTVPRWLPELISWSLSDEYHEVPGGHVRIYRRSVLTGRLEHAGLNLYASHHAHALHSPYWWLKAAVGVSKDDYPLVRAYHKLLVWDITARSLFTRVPEAVLNPLLGKSVVLYLRKAP